MDARVSLFVTANSIADEPIDIPPRRELFVDDAFVERLLGKADFRLHLAAPRGVVMVHDTSWEGNNTFDGRSKNIFRA